MTPQEIIAEQTQAIISNNPALLEDVRAIHTRLLTKNPPAELREAADTWLQQIESAVALMDRHAARGSPKDFLAASKHLNQHLTQVAWEAPLFIAMRDCLYPDPSDEKIANRFSASLMNKAQTLYLKNMGLERHMATLLPDNQR